MCKKSRPSAASTNGAGLRPPLFLEPFVDDAIKLLGYEAIQLLGYEAMTLHRHLAINTELHSQMLKLVRNPFAAELIRIFPKPTPRQL